MCDKFSDAEVKHIREINRQLIAAQNWLVERTKPILELHHETKDTWSERDDVGTGSFFRFSLGNRDPDFDPLRGYNNLLASFNKSPDAMLDSSGVFRMENMDEDNWNEDIEMFPELRDIWFCYLFHNLYEHQLDCDWNDVLKIGEIWVEHIYQKQLIRDWDDEPLPGRCNDRELPSVFHAEIITHPFDQHVPKNNDEFLYARLLNKKIEEVEFWLHSQAREMERLYLDAWRHVLPPDSPDIYEDYVLSARISPMLSAKHHEYKEDEDNMLFTLRKEIPICSEFVFGSPREQLRNEESWKFKEKDIYDNHWRYCTSNGMTPLEKKDWRFCKLFHEIHDSLNNDWNKTLCIGGLWVDIFLKQRRFISLRGETHEHSVYTLGH